MRAEAAQESRARGLAALGQYRVFLAAASLFLLGGSWFLWSSPEYREHHLVLFSLLALPGFGVFVWPLARRAGWRFWLAVGGVGLAHGAAWLGGVGHGASLWSAAAAAGKGLLGVAGVGVLAALWLRTRRRVWLKSVGLSMLLMVLLASLVGYMVVFEKFLPLGGDAKWFDPNRMAALWPSRLLTACHGQMVWENANFAAYYFGLALVLVWESLAAAGGRGRVWRWVLSGALVCALFLTASRMGGLMVALALPVVFFGRPPRFALRAALAAGVGLVCGYLMLTSKVGEMERERERKAAAAAVEAAKRKASGADRKPAAREQDRIPSKAAHTSKYFERASAGRTTAYKALWEEGAEARCCGLGLAATGKDILNLNHEHSSYMATLRGGGLLACAGHLLTLLATAWSCWLLLRRGVRWPVVFALAALGGLLFDRSSVWVLTGFYEFPAHWLALWLALLVSAVPPPAKTSTISPLGG